MAQQIIIKRGTRTPTSFNLTKIGEMAVDYVNEKVYVRVPTKVILVNPTIDTSSSSE